MDGLFREQKEFFPVSKRSKNLTLRSLRSKDKTLFSPYVFRGFTLEKRPVSARLKITGLGLYRAFLNGKRVGKTYLTPGFNDYGSYLRVGTYDVSEMLDEGENELGVFLGDGWYRGEIGLERKKEVYGSEYQVAAELVLTFADGTDGGTANGRKLARPAQVPAWKTRYTTVKNTILHTRQSTLANAYFRTHISRLAPISARRQSKKQY